MERAILGIDAAWTEKQPSGVALVAGSNGAWRLVAAETSYQRFLARADATLVAENRPRGSIVTAAELLAAASALCGRPIDIVAVDMPLAHTKIDARRVSDNAVSRAYGSRKCGTHSPSAERPGCIGARLNDGFAKAGYPLQTLTIAGPALIEVYPHPALVELLGAKERLPYKISKIRNYWRELDPPPTAAERRAKLLDQWVDIVAALEAEISGVSEALPRLSREPAGFELKAYEDALDAVVCAWVGTCALGGNAVPFGDRESAIWIPQERPAVAAPL